ncbi:phospholipase C [Paraburkholderia kirstenboschensis]|uniref:Alkaline phosphatase family protein n=1 Tax=Paraburkholderia kirstenboschensis TaxID=1245436 RepID=A0ABZ0EB73_9BURK|nr:alkaline phosphatase family protein [Paraburkholderia kirstenboschensis]WOD14473.1 alkaline phosphatase family protein [Paraburkholderia kirstenboschensis]
MFHRTLLPIPLAAALFVLSACGSNNGSSSASAPAASAPAVSMSAQDALTTATPIKHLVVIFGENRSFDHYFGTYPNAQNPAGEPAFTAAANTPTQINTLNQKSLLTSNPNFLNTANNAFSAGSGKNPFRLDRSQANTNGQSHDYRNEQLAYNNGAADLFPKFTGNNGAGSGSTFGTPGLVMGYFDGNTVTALWNYAQNFAMSDNMYTGTYGPSTPGALEVVSGQTNGGVSSTGAAQGDNVIADGAGGFTVNGDSDPTGDLCSATTSVTMSANNKNIGDLLNAKNITWGGFMGGFDLSATNPNGTTSCQRSTFSSVLGATKVDYIPHHNWFQYYATTANLAHTRPTSTALIGQTDPLDSTAKPVHHQYDINDFFAAVSSGNYPSVSYLKAPAVGDGHPGNSDPIDEQAFYTKVVNFLEQQPDWKNTAIVITYDDSDGWYDHAYTTPTTSSFDPTADQLNGVGTCNAAGATQGVGVTGAAVNGRCGPGTRVPFIVISPYARSNFVDHTLITQASVVKFIEDNWLGGTRIGGGSHDAATGSLNSLFDFTNGGKTPAVFLDTNAGTKLSSAPAMN